MRYLILLLLTFNLSFSFGQPKTHKHETAITTIYMIDESWSPRAGQRWDTDGNTSYVQIVSGEYFVMSYRVRGKDYYYEGDIESWVSTENKIHFWVRGRELSNGKPILSFDLTYNKNDNYVQMHSYNALGKQDNYYTGRLATIEEIQNLVKHNERN